MLFTLNGRSSFANFVASAAMTTSVVGTAIVAGVSPDGLVGANTVPVPSSMMVTVAGVIALIPPVLVAVKLNGSLLSDS